ncbi:MAG: hypothetical protein A3B13_01655 [Candidatus Liptonbacteria bacterium RIFCSPLOWO2_01_FULL_45_15]|uniref:Uncharacterized protein n=1 Tax=Candidatus Liptonbacteria bacterium RIFCSPLOWO2_01_FULL_45_15 TaxID=1798649 RepID=A0A1G2CFL8_9BACT|nr:MAG: hypothetical protein A3B13_01655 [Candidatus Liptonbacteria bacterium RIFCSPLOWO2_01_FULL_45_15]
MVGFYAGKINFSRILSFMGYWKFLLGCLSGFEPDPRMPQILVLPLHHRHHFIEILFQGLGFYSILIEIKNQKFWAKLK